LFETMNRRSFLRHTGALAAGAAAAPLFTACKSAARHETARSFELSLSQWALHRTIKKGELDPLDFPQIAHEHFGFRAVEYVNQFFMDKARDAKYLGELRRRAGDSGVRNLLIMVDREPQIGHADAKVRAQAVEAHKKWIEASKALGCHSTRINAYGQGSFDEQLDRCAESLHALCEFAAPLGLNVLVENHGGFSSRGDWLAALMKKVNQPNCGTMPDFDNWQFAPGERYDRYQGMKEIMPWARAVSSKAHDFDAQGRETTIDFKRMMKIVLGAGYHGHVNVEYEGDTLSEEEGIRATIHLLERVREELG
jgi:sugar phosphate isomerase/epimerase